MLVVVSLLVVTRLGDYFSQQQKADLEARAVTVASYVEGVVAAAAGVRPVVGPDDVVDEAVLLALGQATQQRLISDRLAQADVRIRLGRLDGTTLVPASNGVITARLVADPLPGQTREAVTSDPVQRFVTSAFVPFGIEVVLSNPYTYRATAIANVTGLLSLIGLAALAVAIIMAATLASRFTTPLRRLTDASRGLAEGDLAQRVPVDVAHAGSIELTDLALQFNAMADRVQESVEIIRRDRDRSRDFLADVSHELRTPIAALRTFNELLTERAGDDPAARAEFLEASAGQLERLDWLAQNLLDLSRLDSGLVLLDLRPEDLRSTVEQAVDQASAAARRRGLELTVSLPAHPLRIRHDPVRMGQVVANLVGNAIKFTPRGGRVVVEVVPRDDGASVVVRDTGVGIDAAELPRIFERFYRGSRASEARGSGSGLGLAIARSIVDMHAGTISVESRVGAGSTFRVDLPRDPRESREPHDHLAAARDEPGSSEPVAETSRDAAPGVNAAPSS
jgi:signal transduction histidine kinase